MNAFIKYSIVLFLFLGIGSAGAQTLPLADDPVAEALDSLLYLSIFEKQTKPVNPKNKYHFAIDSIPVYDQSVVISRLKKLDNQSPFDLVYNDDVQRYIDMYLRKRNLLSKVIGLSQLYFPMFEAMLDKYNMPLELKYLAIVESALNPNARSRAGAVGLWQFMYGTGKLYDLKITSYVDDRCDPIKATEAACEYLQYLYNTFGDWQMAIAAYNCGPGNINKAIRRSGGKTTYWEIRKYLPRETQAYVPSFIAVNYVMHYAAEYNLYAAVPKQTFYQVDTVAIKEQVTFNQLSNMLDIPIEDIQYLNPQYRKNVIPKNDLKPYTLCLPINKIGTFVSNEKEIYNQLNENPETIVTISKEIKKIHYVKKGEHLNLIANKYKCTVSDIMEWNNLKSHKLYVGQKLSVYIQTQNPVKNENTPTVKNTVPVVKQDNTKTAVNSNNNNGVNYKYHTIKSGDSLWNIAQRYNLTLDELKKLNSIGNNNYMLVPGKQIIVGTM